jgi:hypothetical protein
VDFITERWGAERLLFGSNWPLLNHGQTLAMLTCAEVTDEQKLLIAGGNLRRLLGWANTDLTPGPSGLPPCILRQGLVWGGSLRLGGCMWSAL